MRNLLIVAGLSLWCLPLLAAVRNAPAQEKGEIRLLVRADDMGSFHAANVACIRSATDGIARSVELMVPGPWFSEAVEMLKRNPQIDVGIHLVLTSEWASCKWGPVSPVRSLVDANGRFFPMVWRNQKLPPLNSLQESAWELAEVERELRAQIETALRQLPRISHLDAHMAFESLDPRLAQLVQRLRQEYRLQPGNPQRALKFFPGWGRERTAQGRIRVFIENIEKLTPGNYMFVEHPGLNTPEMETVGHRGYEDVAADRDAVTKVFTSPEVIAAIRNKKVQLISYADLGK